MADDRVERYAAGILELARAEDQAERVGDELFRIARALESSPELRETLTDRSLPADRKKGILGDLLEGRAAELTVALVNLVVDLDRVRDLPGIADELVERVSESRDRAVAEVRTAVELDAETIARLEQALGRATGKRIDVKVVIDPSVLGGAVAHVGDTVIDGSLRRRLDTIRQSLQSGNKG